MTAEEHTVETTRIRFMANAFLASGAMFTVGLVCAPLLRTWRWIVWPALALNLVAGVFGWRAYRLWGRWLTEVEARDREGRPFMTPTKED